MPKDSSNNDAGDYHGVKFLVKRILGMRVIFLKIGGKYRRFLNVALPEKPWQIAHCPTCGNTSTEYLLSDNTGACSECRTDHICQIANELQKEGIDLQWRWKLKYMPPMRGEI